jgi:hypothetical protein
LKSMIVIFLLVCLSGCNTSSTGDSVTADPASTPIPKQGFIGHVYAYYGGPAPLCDSDVCSTNVPMREPMGGIHVVVVDPDMQEVLAETVSLQDGSYRVSVSPGTYHVCLKWETGMTCSRADSVPPNTYIVEDFDVGQG